jgi:alpha-1,6-mannosyltransferase
VDPPRTRRRAHRRRAHRASAVLNTRATAAASTLALAFAAGACVARALVANAPQLATLGLAQPLPVVDTWGAFGGACFAILAATIAVASVALLVLLRSIATEGTRLRGFAVCAIAAVALAGAAAWPFVFSSDTYAYAAYGEMAARALDPYVLVPANAHGASIDAARVQWHGVFPVCVYGPAFVAFARAVWDATNAWGAVAPIVALRALAALAFLGSIPLLARALAGFEERTKSLILCAYGLNPMVLWSVAEGHNDAFVLLAAALAAVSLRGGRAALAGAILGLSAAIKAPGAVFAAAFALDARFERKDTRGAIGAAAGLVLAAAISIPPLLPALRAVGAHGQYLPMVSLQAFVGIGPAVAVAVVLLVRGAGCVYRGQREGFASIGLAIVAGLPNPYPWYALWLAPLALAGAPSNAATALYAVTILSVLRYLPDATGNMTVGELALAALGACIPLIVLFAAHTMQKANAPT